MSDQDAGRKTFKFFVDDKRFEWDKPKITGAQIRELAHIDPNFQLFLEEPGPEKPDRLISNDQEVNLEEPGVEKFYTVPPATFG